MKRFDLRHLKENFLERLLEIMSNLEENEVGIFIFEINNFDDIQKSADLIRDNDFTLMNSLRFNEVDWTLVVKKQKPQKSILDSTKQASQLDSTQDKES